MLSCFFFVNKLLMWRRRREERSPSASTPFLPQKNICFKGSLTRDFRLQQVFFMNQCPSGPQEFHWGHFEFFRKFAEIYANECLIVYHQCQRDKLFSSVNDTGDKFIAGVTDFQWSPVSLILAINLSPMSTTTVYNYRRWQRHRWTIIAGDNDTGEQLSPVTTTPVNNYRRWQHHRR